MSSLHAQQTNPTNGVADNAPWNNSTHYMTIIVHNFQSDNLWYSTKRFLSTDLSNSPNGQHLQSTNEILSTGLEIQK
jgi:hypothetical protein